MASGEGAEVAAAGAGGKGEERGEHAAALPRADLFNLADSDMLGGSVVADILVVSENQGEEAGRMAMAGSRRQPTAPNVPAGAMKSILPEVRRKEEAKFRIGRTGARAAEGWNSGVRPGGRERTGKGGKGPVGVSGARQAAGHQEGKGGKGGGQGRQWPQPQQSFTQQPPGSLPQVSAAVRADEEEREARRQQTARYEALAHIERQRCRRQAPRPEPDTIYRQEMGSGRGRPECQGEQGGTGVGHSSQTQWRTAGRGRAGWAEQRSSGRKGERVGGSEAGRQERYRAGVQGAKKLARAGMMNKVHEG